MRIFLTLLTSLLFTTHTYAIDTVDDLQVDRYSGLWHQLGAIPQDFAEDCVRNTTAEYSILEDSTIKVLNSCEEEDGDVSVAEGRARVNSDFQKNSKLEVTFVNLFGNWLWSLSGDYWVIDLDPDYQWSLVGHPELSGLYILSRTPTLPSARLKSMRDFIESVGYDSCNVIMSQTPGGSFSGTERFCDLNL